MKQGIHPRYNKVMVHCTTCGNEFEAGSTRKELRVDTCSKCHPFYTGKQKHGAVAGRVDRFNKKYGFNSDNKE
ncbi:50S ribosomal protein L31 [Mycoplasmatota bacterium]|nr:50S ribosomal protein L31 [Mycoplasmatota bacterium]